VTAGPAATAKNARVFAMRVVGVLGLALMVAVIFHKGIKDVGRLAFAYSGGDFWRELAKYIFHNLAGG
jgi:hypothetical protein